MTRGSTLRQLGAKSTRPLSMPVALLLAGLGTIVSVYAIAWAIKAALHVG